MAALDSTKSPLASRLRSARLVLGISQRELGLKAEIDPSSASARINQYEQGKHSPDFQTAARLAMCLEVPVTYLYATNDSLAELILAFEGLKPRQQQEAVRYISTIEKKR